jgi:hypothetical protein
LVKSKYHTGTQMEHRMKSTKAQEDKMTPCGVQVFRCVAKKKAECRKRSRIQLARKMGLDPKDLSIRYPNYDVHHKVRMTFKAEPGCSCSLSCPVGNVALVPSSWNRGVMKKFETSTQSGYSFEEQMKGVRKKGASKTPPPLPDMSIERVTTKGRPCIVRAFSKSVNRRVVDRAYISYRAISKRPMPLNQFRDVITKSKPSSFTIAGLRALDLKGAGLHLLNSIAASAKLSTNILDPIVVLRTKGMNTTLLDGKQRIRLAHAACPASAKVGVIVLHES